MGLQANLHRPGRAVDLRLGQACLGSQDSRHGFVVTVALGAHMGHELLAFDGVFDLQFAKLGDDFRQALRHRRRELTLVYLGHVDAAQVQLSILGRRDVIEALGNLAFLLPEGKLRRIAALRVEGLVLFQCEVPA